MDHLQLHIWQVVMYRPVILQDSCINSNMGEMTREYQSSTGGYIVYIQRRLQESFYASGGILGVPSWMKNSETPWFEVEAVGEL